MDEFDMNQLNHVNFSYLNSHDQYSRYNSSCPSLHDHQFNNIGLVNHIHMPEYNNILPPPPPPLAPHTSQDNNVNNQHNHNNYNNEDNNYNDNDNNNHNSSNNDQHISLLHHHHWTPSPSRCTLPSLRPTLDPFTTTSLPPLFNTTFFSNPLLTRPNDSSSQTRPLNSILPGRNDRQLTPPSHIPETLNRTILDIHPGPQVSPHTATSLPVFEGLDRTIFDIGLQDNSFDSPHIYHHHHRLPLASRFWPPSSTHNDQEQPSMNNNNTQPLNHSMGSAHSTSLDQSYLHQNDLFPPPSPSFFVEPYQDFEMPAIPSHSNHTDIIEITSDDESSPIHTQSPTSTLRKRRRSSSSGSRQAPKKAKPSPPPHVVDLVDVNTDKEYAEKQALQKVEAEKARAAEEADKPIRLTTHDCIICLDSPTDLTVTWCGHLFCSECLFQALKVDPRKKWCPICRQPISMTPRPAANKSGVRPSSKGVYPLALKLMTKKRKGKRADALESAPPEPEAKEKEDRWLNDMLNID